MSTEHQVLCRGLPWESTEQDLRDFFGNSGVDNVDIPKRNGRTCGDATVTFSNEDDYNRALKKDREHLGNRYIEVFPINSAPRRRERDDFRPRGGGPPRDRYSDRGAPRGGGSGGGTDPIVRLRGLPFSVTIRDINDFFAPLPIVRDGILLPDQQRARPGGEAYVCFESMESMQIAKQRHMKNIGHRYIEVFEASQRELNRFAEENGLRVPRLGPSPFVSSPPAPAPRASAYDPYQSDSYRSGSSMAADYRRAEPEDPYGRSRTSEYSARPTYDPYQQVAAAPAYQSQQPVSGGYYDSYAPKTTYDSYDRAPDHRDLRGDTRDVVRDSRDLSRELPREHLRDSRDSRLSDPRALEPRALEPRTSDLYGDSRHSDYGYESSRDSYWRSAAAGQPSLGGERGNGSAGAVRDPYSVGDSWASSGGGGVGGQLASDRDRYGSGSYTAEPYGQREVSAAGAIRRTEYGRMDDRERDRDRYARPDPYARDRDYGHSAAAPSQQNQHFVLRMRGVPFRATETDVYDFFHPIRPNQVDLIRDNQFQRPSGDARVIFYSRKDYDDALMKDKQYMGERYIEMIPDNGRY